MERGRFVAIALALRLLFSDHEAIRSYSARHGARRWIGRARHHPTPSAAEIHLLPGIVADADQKTAKDVVAAFERADAAVQQADLDALMPFYAQGYNYYGLKRADVRRIWSEVFMHYRDLTSRHMFTEVKVWHSGSVKKAAVTCTGGFMGSIGSPGNRSPSIVGRTRFTT
ncbi:MAG: hypothetical protein U0412_06035 [Nitrospira sp.]